MLVYVPEFVCIFTKRIFHQALPAGKPLPEHADMEEVTMKQADLSHMGQSAAGRGGAYDEDDEGDGQGGQRVQCAQQ